MVTIRWQTITLGLKKMPHGGQGMMFVKMPHCLLVELT